MTDTSPALDLAGISLIGKMDAAIDAVRDHTFPRIQIEVTYEEDDEGEVSDWTITCPWCKGEDTEYVAIDNSFRYSGLVPLDSDDVGMKVWYITEGGDDYGSTIYYKHNPCGRPVSLPDDEWKENWS